MLFLAIMGLIVNGGNANSSAFEAVQQVLLGETPRTSSSSRSQPTRTPTRQRTNGNR